MKRTNVTINRANELPAGSIVKWLKDGLFYKRHEDGVFERHWCTPQSECECECHYPGISVFHCMPCCGEDPDELFIVESD